jgi:hypothetical protein
MNMWIFIFYMFRNVIEVYKNHRKFGMSFNTELGHDYINFYQLADKDSMEFLQWMYEKNLYVSERK